MGDELSGDEDTVVSVTGLDLDSIECRFPFKAGFG